jgi:hypothetical protein
MPVLRHFSAPAMPGQPLGKPIADPAVAMSTLAISSALHADEAESCLS